MGSSARLVYLLKQVLFLFIENLLEYIIFLFIIIQPNIYSILGSKSLEVNMPVVPASLIEGIWHTYILLLLVIVLNPYHFYALFCGALTYCDIYICLYLVYRIRAYIWLLILIHIFVTRQYFILYSICVWFKILFSSWLLLFITYLLRRLLASQSALNGVFNIISCPKTSWPGLDFSVVWYVNYATKAVADNILDQG